MRLIQALATLLLLASTLSQFDDLPASVRVQLSPRLLYRRKSGIQTDDTDPVGSVRVLLEKMELDHLNFEVVQAIEIPTYGLLFEMQSYDQAIEIATTWKRILRHNSEYGVVDTCPRGDSACVGPDFELQQTERDFFVGPSRTSTNFVGPTFRRGD
ncbi:GL23510 [Drosophila persimilis]|uniref:GL23510 n=1 Tax=Drosophila persimilis TaxID=7234 RepID=B4G317_DROPE|nr:uncharacterized protein LOC6588561 [Drosophila persimilis]EDW24212.1 GL23510 [Drosophila persimilis]